MSNFSFKQGLVHLKSLDPIHDLFYACQEIDGYPIKNYWHILLERQQDPQAIDFLCFADNQLIGALNVFFFAGSVELVPYVHPQFRGKGIGKTLFRIALNKLNQYIVPAYSFIIHASCTSLIQKCQANGATFDHEEVEMRAPAILPPLDVPAIKLKQATLSDIAELAILHEQAFKQPSRQEMEQRFAVALLEPHRKMWLAYNKDNAIVGKIHLREDFNRIVLHDVGIAVEFRQQNYGKALMLTWLKQYANDYADKTVVVEVLGDNAAALRLYERCQFTLTQRYQFWRFPFENR